MGGLDAEGHVRYRGDIGEIQARDMGDIGEACTPKITYMRPMARPLTEPPVRARGTPFLKMAST